MSKILHPPSAPPPLHNPHLIWLDDGRQIVAGIYKLECVNIPFFRKRACRVVSATWRSHHKITRQRSTANIDRCGHLASFAYWRTRRLEMTASISSQPSIIASSGHLQRVCKLSFLSLDHANIVICWEIFGLCYLCNYQVIYSRCVDPEGKKPKYARPNRVKRFVINALKYWRDTIIHGFNVYKTTRMHQTRLSNDLRTSLKLIKSSLCIHPSSPSSYKRCQFENWAMECPRCIVTPIRHHKKKITHSQTHTHIKINREWRFQFYLVGYILQITVRCKLNQVLRSGLNAHCQIQLRAI